MGGAARGRTLLISGHNSIAITSVGGGGNGISREGDRQHAAAVAAGATPRGDLVLLPHSGHSANDDADCDCGGQKANGA